MKKSILSGGNIFWVGPDLYITSLKMDRDVSEIWMARDSLGLSFRAVNYCGKYLTLDGLFFGMNDEAKDFICEKANMYLVSGDERIVREGEWYAIDYGTAD